MDRNREARRASIVGSNGFNRRRHRTNSLRDSPDEDGGLELQESVRLRDRVKKDRDRERERDRDRERERDRDLRERSSRSKRRRAERLASNIVGDETSEESVNDDEDEEDEENPSTTAGGGGFKLGTPEVGSIQNHHHHHGSLTNNHHNHSSSFSQQVQNTNPTTNIVSSNHHLQHRKSYPPLASSSKVFRAPPVWKSGDEMISVSVPRKARTASTKRSHDWISSSSNNNSGGGVSGGEQALRPELSSPARQSLVPPSTPLPAAPMSPSSSNPSMKKKLKPSMTSGGPKLKPPKVSSKPSSSNPEELEIEIAEVLYGLMTQAQGPSLKKEDSRDANRSSSDPKSMNSSPISNSTSVNNPHFGTNSTPFSVIAPKRKRPRHVPETPSYVGRCGTVASKPDPNQPLKIEVSSPVLDKLGGSAVDIGFTGGGNMVNLHVLISEPTEPAVAESMKIDSDYKSLVDEEVKDQRDFSAKVEYSSPKEKESMSTREDDSINKDAQPTATASAIKASSPATSKEIQKEAKFEIDLMAPPPQSRSSCEREATHVEIVAAAVNEKLVLSADASLKAAMESKDVDNDKSGRNLLPNVVAEEEKVKMSAEDSESGMLVENKGTRSINLQLDLEKPDKEIGVGVNAVRNKSQLPSQMHVKATREEPLGEKSGPSASSLHLPMSMASWPGGLPPPMGYMAPLQGVVSMDGSTVAPTHLQPLFSQPRPKRCATHCHIARNIHLLQQFMKMSPFWPGAPNAASLFGSKTCNLNALPAAAELQGNMSLRSLNNAVDKGQSVAAIANNGGKDNASQAAGSASADSAPRKQQQILFQQAIPPVAAGNLLGPAFIFPLNQQASGVVARPGVPKSSTVDASANSSSASASIASSAAAATMSFNYPNMAPNESQYLAILPNTGYPFPMPTVGAPPNYRGPPPQAMPLFNGSFYSSPMIHPSQLQHSQRPPAQVAQLMQAQQNAAACNGSSSSQKHIQSQQPRPQIVGASSGSGNGSLQNFTSHKIQSSQQLQQSHNVQYTQPPSRARHHEGEMGGEDSLSSNDCRGSRSAGNIYGQNLGFPIHPQNFSLMTSPPVLASATNTNQNDKKAHQSQQQGMKTGMEALPHHGFAVSFGGMNGTNAMDVATMAQTHAMFQSSSEATRQNIQMMAAAAVAAQVAQKKNNHFRISEDVKSGVLDSITADDERKMSGGKALGQSIAFTRSDMVDGPVNHPNNVIESSSRSLSVTGTIRSSQAATGNSMDAMNVQNSHIQAQFQQQQQHQMLQLKQQQQEHQRLSATSVRNKVPVTSNGNIYSEHFNSPSAVANKFPSALSGFPQNLVQSNTSSPTHSPQWKGSNRTNTSQAPASMAPSTNTTVKNHPQQHSRAAQPPHTQISFGGNQKASSNSQGQPPSSSNQAPSSPMMVGSPTTSSISKGASGSPRMNASASANNKMGHAPLSAQQPKNSQSITNQKAASVLGNHHITSSSASSAAKAQMQHQQSQQQLPKAMQQAQLFFSNPYTQTQPPHTVTTGSAASSPGGYYLQRRQAPNAPSTSSAGMLTLSPPVTHAGTSTSDPAKAIAAATGNLKGAGLPSHGIMNVSQFTAQSGGTVLPAGFSYLHPVPAAVQVKPGEQKQPAGHDTLHEWQPEKK